MINDCHDITNNDNLMSRKEPSSEEKRKVHNDNGSEGENPTHWKITKRKRKYIEINGDDIGNYSPDGINRLASKDDILNDCLDEVSRPLVADCLKKECYCCSNPIDEPVWSGLLNIGNKEYMPLSGHLSTKSSEKVRNLSKSLSCVVQMAKLPRSKV
ncbi:hypothetical protein SEVIR_2G165210v4 [Setaria viridis]